MSDKNRDNATMDEEGVFLFGEKLKATRESMGMSVQDAASRLHLSPRFILMLENENLLQSKLPLIYLRGYLRSYSKVLNISEKELAPLLEKLDPQPAMETPVAATSSDSLSLSFPLENNPYFARAATVIISLMLLTGMTTWWYHHASFSSTTVVALNQPLNPETTIEAPKNEQAVKSEQITTSFNTPSPETSISINNEPLTTPPINLAAQKPLALASSAPTSGNNTSEPIAKKAHGTDASEEESSDEQE